MNNIAAAPPPPFCYNSDPCSVCFLVPFDLRFSEVTGISQKVSNDIAQQRLATKSFALKMEPKGIAPYYSFMMLLDCAYGEKVQKVATQNLGKFIVHVLNSPNLKAQLVDTDKISTDWLAGTAKTLQLGTAIAGYYASSAPAMTGTPSSTTGSQLSGVSASIQRVFSEIETDRNWSLKHQLDESSGEATGEPSNTQ